MQLSARLETILNMAGTGSAVADIGTDHGYIPIELVRRGRFPSAFAMDVRKGPLGRASEHIRQAGLSDSVVTRLSDGLEHLAPGEADTIIIAGMGGPLMERLLTDGWETAAAAEKLILSPQSEIGHFHHFLLEKGWEIGQEVWIQDEGKFYVIIRTCHDKDNAPAVGELTTDMHIADRSCAVSEVNCEDADWSEAELEYGRIPLREQSPALKQMLEHRVKTCEEVLSHLEGISGDSAAERRAEMEQTVRIAREALDFFTQGQVR